MEIRSECVPCLMERVRFQAILAGNGTEFSALKEAMRTYAEEFAEGRNSAEVATAVHRSAYAAMGISDPYHELKVRADDVAMEYLNRAKDMVDRSEDRLRTAVLLSVIGNIMDFGSGIAIDDPDDFRNEFEKLLSQGIGSDDTDKMEAILKNAKKVIFVFDNCGEGQLDKILINELRSYGVKVIGVVRGKPILNDITKEDAERIGLDKILDGLYTTGQFAIGIDLNGIGEDLKKEIETADIMIAKGMANYESLSDQPVNMPIVHILRTKCKPVADSLGIPTGINVVRFISGK